MLCCSCCFETLHLLCQYLYCMSVRVVNTGLEGRNWQGTARHAASLRCLSLSRRLTSLREQRSAPRSPSTTASVPAPCLSISHPQNASTHSLDTTFLTT